jgi:ribosome maturation factor RimP
MRKDLQDLWLLAEPHVRDAGFDLIEVQFAREPSGAVLRLFIDRPAASGRPVASVGSVTHEDCERVSRDVSAALDVADHIPHAYQLEVSSPGLDRPLRRERDFARFVGESARIRLNDGVEGRRNFSGTIRAARDGRVEIACDGRSYELPVDDIARANLIPDWDREFARTSSHDRVGEGPPVGPDDRVGGELASPARPHRGGAWGPLQGPHSKRSAS